MCFKIDMNVIALRNRTVYKILRRDEHGYRSITRVYRWKVGAEHFREPGDIDQTYLGHLEAHAGLYVYLTKAAAMLELRHRQAGYRSFYLAKLRVAPNAFIYKAFHGQIATYEHATLVAVSKTGEFKS